MCRGSVALAVVLSAINFLDAAAILTEDFETPGKWQKIVKGKGSIEIVANGHEGKCVKVESKDSALVYYVRPIDPKLIAGKKLMVRAKVKLDNVVKGDMSYSRAKLKIMAHAGKKPINMAYNFDGDQDWHDRVYLPEVPGNITRAELQLGIQNGTGTVYFDSLAIDDGSMLQHALDLKVAANAAYNGAATNFASGQTVDTPIDLTLVPKPYWRFAEVDFQLMLPMQNYGRNCIILAGKRCPDLPKVIENVIRVDTKSPRLFFLQAALDVDPSRPEPCLVYEIHYGDGKAAKAAMREGVDIGAIDNPKDLPNWRVGWRTKKGDREIGLGVATWDNPRAAVKIDYLRVSTRGTGAVPVVAAISLEPVR